MKNSLFFIFLLISNFLSQAQSTDLSIVVEAQDLSGNALSLANIYQEFQYIITVFNSGSNVSNATFNQIIDNSVAIQSYTSINQTGGASPINPITITGNTIDATIASLPSNSSVALKVIVRAPLGSGGIATNVNVFPPDGTTDSDTSNNTSIISIDIVEIPIDFTVTYNQINPTAGNSINNWNESITYQFTITNNSSVSYPLMGFKNIFTNNLSTFYGYPYLQLLSVNCTSASNGMNCIDTSNLNGNPTYLSSSLELFNYTSAIEFLPGGSMVFEMEVLFLDPYCATILSDLDLSSFVELTLSPSDINQSPNQSNSINNILLESFICPEADLCISTVQTNPDATQEVSWNEEVTFVTDVCNMGPEDAYMRFFSQNLTSDVNWQIQSITCNSTTGMISCTDFTLSDQNSFWESSEFILPANSTITVTTVAIFFEPDSCTPTTEDYTNVHIRSGVNLLDNSIIDPNITNDYDSDFVLLPPLPLCDVEEFADLSITKTQVNPELPAGINNDNTIEWGEVTYNVVATNNSNEDTIIELSDFLNDGSPGTLVSVTCLETTGTASCYTIVNENVGVFMDGIPEDGVNDVFWQITADENVTLPAQSSITYQVVIDWAPECTTNDITVRNNATIASVDNPNEINTSDNTVMVVTYMAPCIDILVQTYPEFTSVDVDTAFNWIIDITNSNSGSSATNIDFEDVLGPQFTINGSPSCNVTVATASCTPTLTVSGNTVNGIIPIMEAGSTIQIVIPVLAPSFGGAFTNTAQAIGNSNENNELTPETNLSISNMQVIAPTVLKTFTPDQIIVGQESTLTFTVFNISGNASQSNIAFTDNLPTGMTIAGPVNWSEQNGCSATFNSNIGDTSFNVTNLTFPNGVESCTFEVIVTSNTEGEFINNSTNFSDLNNIDSALANATLTVLEDNTDVDIQILKSVTPSEASIGNTVQFTIAATNLGTTNATNIEILEMLPLGYAFISAQTSMGSYNNIDNLWSLSNLLPNQSETLTLNAQVVSSNDLLNQASLVSVSEVDRDDSNNEDQAEVNVNNCLNIPSGFSPGNDATNDTFKIPCIEDYPYSSLNIYNRYGTLIYQNNNYNNTWNGMPNSGPLNQNRKLPIGTYYYVFTVKAITKPFVGYVYLNY